MLYEVITALKARMGMGKPSPVPAHRVEREGDDPPEARSPLPEDRSAPAAPIPSAPAEPAPAESAQAETAPLEELSASPRIPFGELQEALVAFFQTTKNMVATGLKQAFDWEDAQDAVRFSVDKPLVHNLLRITSYNVCYTKLLRWRRNRKRRCAGKCRRRRGGP